MRRGGPGRGPRGYHHPLRPPHMHRRRHYYPPPYYRGCGGCGGCLIPFVIGSLLIIGLFILFL